MALSHTRVILVQPHYPGNIGAAARVMRNMGIHDLVLVNPLANHLDAAAKQMSTQGEEILHRARVVAHLDEALGDCVVVVATSARTGGLFRNQNVLGPAQAMPHLVEALTQDRPAGLVFGPEPTGLSNADIARAQYLITIPTDDAYPALNLAQAVAICLYQLRVAWEQRTPVLSDPSNLRANIDAQERMFQQLQNSLEEIHFLYGDKADALMHALRHLLGRANLSEMEVKLLQGLARQIRWFVDQKPKTLTLRSPE